MAESQVIQILNFPFPITISAAFANKSIRTGGGRYPTKAFMEYRDQVEQYRLKNLAEMKEAKKVIQEWIKSKSTLYVECALVSDRWYNKDGTVKKRDVANLEKVLIDSLTYCLGFDDCNIWDLRLIKIIGQIEKSNIFIEPAEVEIDGIDIDPRSTVPN